MKVPEPIVVQFSNRDGEGVEWVVVRHVVKTTRRRDPHTHMRAIPDFEDAFDCFREKADSIRRNTSIFIGSLIRSCSEKLIDQVSIRSMNLDPVKSCCLRVACCPPIIVQSLFDPASCQGNWLRNRCQTRGNQRLAVGTDRGWSNGLRVVWQQGRMRDAADMPQLKEDSASTLTNGFNDLGSTLAPVRGNESLEY